MNKPFHINLSEGRWQTMTIVDQLANVGSEFERSWNWRSKNKMDLANSAFERMHELMQLTLSDARWQSHRIKELKSLNNALQTEWESQRKYAPEDLRKYFITFAIWSRANQSHIDSSQPELSRSAS